MLEAPAAELPPRTDAQRGPAEGFFDPHQPAAGPSTHYRSGDCVGQGAPLDVRRREACSVKAVEEAAGEQAYWAAAGPLRYESETIGSRLYPSEAFELCRAGLLRYGYDEPYVSELASTAQHWLAENIRESRADGPWAVEVVSRLRADRCAARIRAKHRAAEADKAAACAAVEDFYDNGKDAGVWHNLCTTSSETETQKELTMRETVKVNGVELTRAQVEHAMKELDAPLKPKRYRYPQTLVLDNGLTEFVVPSYMAEYALNKEFFGRTLGSTPDDQQMVICSKRPGGNSSYDIYSEGGVYEILISRLSPKKS
jgi:hypothetical protein